MSSIPCVQCQEGIYLWDESDTKYENSSDRRMICDNCGHKYSIQKMIGSPMETWKNKNTLKFNIIEKLENVLDRLNMFEYDVNQQSFLKEDIGEVINMVKEMKE